MTAILTLVGTLLVLSFAIALVFGVIVGAYQGVHKAFDDRLDKEQ